MTNETSGGHAALIEALQFYADGNHFTVHDQNAWDTVSGEPANFYEDEANTATVEDGSIAKMALAALTSAPAETPPAAGAIDARGQGVVALLRKNDDSIEAVTTPGWKLHRCADGGQCRASIGGGCASGWCEHFDVKPDDEGTPRFPAAKSHDDTLMKLSQFAHTAAHMSENDMRNNLSSIADQLIALASRSEAPAAAGAAQAVAGDLHSAVFAVLEGFTLPHAVRKMLESAYYSNTMPALDGPVSEGPHAAAVIADLPRFCASGISLTRRLYNDARPPAVDAGQWIQTAEQYFQVLTNHRYAHLKAAQPIEREDGK